MSEDIFLRGRINWLNEIQIFRKDLQNIKVQLTVFSKKHEINEDEVNLFTESINTINKRLDNTEKNILYSLNNGKTYWLDSSGNSAPKKIEGNVENELFDSMKSAYIALMDLLKDIHNFLQKKIESE